MVGRLSVIARTDTAVWSVARHCTADRRGQSRGACAPWVDHGYLYAAPIFRSGVPADDQRELVMSDQLAGWRLHREAARLQATNPQEGHLYETGISSYQFRLIFI